MSSTATATATVVIGPFSTTSSSNRNARTTFAANFTSRSFPSTSLSSNRFFFRLPHTSFSKRSPTFRRFKRFSPVMEWQDCTVKMEVDVPISVAYACYSDREAIPEWMPFISTVKILPAKPDLSQWSLKYKAFGQNIEFSWLARNMQPTPNQKIHWRSLDGLPNRGAVRFYPKGPSSCLVELTVSYEVPQLLAPVASALQPFLEGLLKRGLERFATFAKSYK
uniref:Coenzyme Q-binding protein COQ10 START domain-containing protein n=1 Tax=Medicago truncatula TaxID=3880 RepID=B7FHB4_MEDTR|nr:unknown [Medicago truncatula]